VNASSEWQCALVRQLRGLDQPESPGVEAQATYVLEWAEEQLGSVCPLTSEILMLDGLFELSIATVLRGWARPRSLHTFRRLFLTAIASRGPQFRGSISLETSAVARFELRIDADLDTSQGATAQTDCDDVLRLALRRLGISVV
jgi:hypothetical protein